VGKVPVDGRFKGGWITRAYGKPSEGVEALQLELACRAYMREPERPAPENWPTPNRRDARRSHRRDAPASAGGDSRAREPMIPMFSSPIVIASEAKQSRDRKAPSGSWIASSLRSSQ